jgi:hypothetical protein
VHEPTYYVPALVLFGALLPLAVIDSWATVIANFLAGRRERRLMRPRPRVTYLFLTLGWVVIGAACGLLAWAADARPTGPSFGPDGATTWLVWATVISGGAAVMMIGRVLPSGTVRWPARPVRRGAAQLENLSGPPPWRRRA